MKNEDIEALKRALYKSAAEVNVMNQLLTALLMQVPDKKRLLADFDREVERETVSAMNDSVPEVFVDMAQTTSGFWRARIADAVRAEQVAAANGSRSGLPAAPTDDD